MSQKQPFYLYVRACCGLRSGPGLLKRFILIMLFLFMSAAATSAQCSGSGTSWSCAAGSSVSQVQSAVNSASNGATITLAAGTYNWSGHGPVQLNPCAGVTLICASAPASAAPWGASTTAPCLINSSGYVFGYVSITSGTNSNLYRISGFTFHNSASDSNEIWFNDDCVNYPSPCTGTLSQVRVDHNTADQTNISNFIYIGDIASYVKVFGVVDHNLIQSSTSLWGTNAGNGGIVQWIGGNTDPNPLPYQYGTSNNLFIENNTVNFGTANGGPGMTNAGSGVVDGWGPAAVVVRYNTIVDGLTGSHGVTHGGGPTNYEYYGNSTTMDSGSAAQGEQDCYRCFHHQGSNTIFMFNNAFTPYSGHSSDPIEVLSYRDYAFGGGGSPGATGASLDGSMVACDGNQTNINGWGVGDGNRPPTSTWYGYPCWHQPGRTATGVYAPMYAWNNIWTDGTAFPNNGGFNMLDHFAGTPPPNCVPQPAGTCDYSGIHEVANRDYFNPVSPNPNTSPTSPFNGTTGMGFGALANRPTTCTTSTETAYGNGAAGVGYFATDVGSQGTLYTCSATNTWSVYYTPYTYPHPLVSGPTNTSSSGGGSSSQPAPPTYLNATVE